MFILIIGRTGSGKGVIADAIVRAIRKREGKAATVHMVDENDRTMPKSGHIIVKCNRFWWGHRLANLVGDRI